MMPTLLPSGALAMADALSLIKRVFVEHDGRIDPPSSMHRLSLTDMNAAGKEVWVIGPAPRAVVILTPMADCLYLGKLAVAPEARGQGLSRALVERAVDRARQLGLPCVDLETRIELIENHTAFAKMGFVKVQESAHPGFDRPTSIRMRRLVA